MALLEYGVKTQELIDLMQEIYPTVMSNYDHVSNAFIIKYANFVRQSKDITQEQLEDVLALLSKSAKPNLKIIELFLAEKKTGEKQTSKKTKVEPSESGFASNDLGLVSNSIIQACIDKVSLHHL